MWVNFRLDYRSLTSAIVWIFVGLISGSCANVFNEMAQKETEAAKLYQVRKLVSSGQWSSAITTIGTLSTATQAQRDVKVLLASAYAGTCGLDVLNLIKNLQSGSSGRLFVMLFGALRGATASSVSYCFLAESTLKSISEDATLRTSSENLLMAFLSFAKIGAIIAAKGDTNADGVLDGTYNPCTNAADLASSGNSNNIDVNNIVTAVALLTTSLAGLSGSWTTSLSSLNTFCTAIAAAAGGENVCGMVNVASVEASSNKTSIRQAFRALLVEGTSVGLGIGAACSTAFDAACLASCLGT